MHHPIHDVGEFYAHALAIEREACERYAEFESYFKERGEELLAGLCGNLSRMEGEHLKELLQASRDVQLPVIAPGEHRWLEAGSPEVAAREVLHRVATPGQLLEVALQAECAALAFFEWAAGSASDPAVRSLAHEMAADEVQHVLWVRNALEYREEA